MTNWTIKNTEKLTPRYGAKSVVDGKKLIFNETESKWEEEKSTSNSLWNGMKKDVIRQKNIEEAMGCKFLRIEDKMIDEVLK